MKLEENTILIDCPHKPNSKHKAVLHVWPHTFAGLWECQYGYSDDHEHDNYEIADVVHDYHDPGDYYGHGQRTEQVYVCGTCGAMIEDADPKADAYDAMVDAQIEE